MLIFFGIVDTKNKFYLISSEYNDNPQLIKDRVHQLFTPLSSIIVNGALYAQGTRQLLHKTKLFSSVKCTTDLSATNCKKCLDYVITELIDCSYKMKCGRAMYRSCYIRFELYNFY
ncbi:hypothetical protein PRUPE_7G024300 [Prunus persica]|uniref:Uncharacterized protein n=1 Tax=Prunus persica TaxID=3760 RepID=M5VRY0_PRUPE|nr:hypothetical protein PRUPE_7G024300 [Prunus persica]